MKYLNLTLNLSLLIGILFIFQDERNNRLKLEDLSNRIDNVNSEFDIYKHKINSLSPEEQNKLPLEDWENVRDVANLQFYNFINKELENYINNYITVLDVHE